MSLLMERDDEGRQVEILWKWRKRAVYILQKITTKLKEQSMIQ